MLSDKKYPKKRPSILLISPNFTPEPIGIGKVNGEMINWLAKNGYECDVITAFPYYPEWRIQAPYKNRWFKRESMGHFETGGSISVIRCPFYVPVKPSGIKRIMQDISYWFSMPWIVLKLITANKKYDLIITVAPPFHLGYLGLRIREKTGGKVLYHVQDLQIEAAQELNIIPGTKLFDYFYKIEKSILDKADFVSGISPNMVKKIKAKTDRDVIYFPNWVDTDFFHPVANRSTLKEKWGFQPNDVVFLYSGAIGEKQGLENILLAAQDLITDPAINFIICGSGPYSERLIKMMEDMRLKSVSFIPIRDVTVFNEFLNMADYHLILQKGNASDLVMPSKLSTILAIGGVSIVTTTPGTSLYNLYQENDIGYVIEPDDHKVLSKLISGLKPDAGFLKKAENARHYAINHLNIESIMPDLLNKVLADQVIKNEVN